MGPRGGECGGIITGWLFQLVVILAVISLVVYEVVAIGVAAVALDETARGAAEVARDAYRAQPSLPTAQEAVEAELDLDRAELVSLQEIDGELVITLSMRARTLLVHRVGPMEGLATASTTRRVRW